MPPISAGPRRRRRRPSRFAHIALASRLSTACRAPTASTPPPTPSTGSCSLSLSSPSPSSPLVRPTLRGAAPRADSRSRSCGGLAPGPPRSRCAPESTPRRETPREAHRHWNDVSSEYHRTHDAIVRLDTDLGCHWHLCGAEHGSGNRDMFVRNEYSGNSL